MADFVEFLEAHDEIKQVNMDGWMGFLEFSNTVGKVSCDTQGTVPMCALMLLYMSRADCRVSACAVKSYQCCMVIMMRVYVICFVSNDTTGLR